jgi:DNA repair protein RadC
MAQEMEEGRNLDIVDSWAILQEQAPQEAQELAAAHTRNPEIVERRILERAAELTQEPGVNIPPPQRTALPGSPLPVPATSQALVDQRAPEPQAQPLPAPQEQPTPQVPAGLPSAPQRQALPQRAETTMQPDAFAEGQFGPAPTRIDREAQAKEQRKGERIERLTDRFYRYADKSGALTDPEFREKNANLIEQFEQGIDTNNLGMTREAINRLNKKIRQYNQKKRPAPPAKPKGPTKSEARAARKAARAAKAAKPKATPKPKAEPAPAPEAKAEPKPAPKAETKPVTAKELQKQRRDERRKKEEAEYRAEMDREIDLFEQRIKDTPEGKWFRTADPDGDGMWLIKLNGKLFGTHKDSGFGLGTHWSWGEAKQEGSTVKFIKDQGFGSQEKNPVAETRNAALAAMKKKAKPAPKAEPKAEAKPAEPAVKEFNTGNTWRASIPQTDSKARGRWALVDAATDIKTSTEKGFDQRLQPRDRTARNVLSTEQIRRISLKPDADRLGMSGTTDAGAPIVAPDGSVISGNGRVEGIRKAYAKDNAVQYRKDILEMAEDVGITVPAEIENPMLVRVLIEDPKGMSLEEFAERSNQSDMLGRSPEEMAEAGGKAILKNPSMLDKFTTNEKGDLDLAANRDFMKDLEAAIGQNLRNKEGGFTPEAYDLAGKSIIGAVLSGMEGSRDIIDVMIRDQGNLGMKEVVKGITGAGGPLLKIAKDKPQYDLLPAIREAVAEYVSYKQAKKSDTNLTVDMFVDQGDVLVGLPKANALFHYLVNNDKRISAKAVRELLLDYSKRVGNIDTTTMDMFKQPDATPMQILEGVKREKEGTDQDEQPELLVSDVEGDVYAEGTKRGSTGRRDTKSGRARPEAGRDAGETAYKKPITPKEIKSVEVGEKTEREHAQGGKDKQNSPAFVTQGLPLFDMARLAEETPVRREIHKSTLRDKLDKVKHIHVPHMKITNAVQAAEVLHELRNPGQEKVVLLPMDKDNNVLPVGPVMLTLGTLTSSAYTLKLVERALQQTGAQKFIIMHNHPSGDPRPSSADKAITDLTYKYLKKSKSKAELVDHIILNGDTAYSFKEGVVSYTRPETTKTLPLSVLGPLAEASGTVMTYGSASSPSDVATFAKEYLQDGGVMVMGTNSRNKVIVSSLTDLDHLDEGLRQQFAVPGVRRIVLAYNEGMDLQPELVQEFIDAGIPIVDAVKITDPATRKGSAEYSSAYQRGDISISEAPTQYSVRDGSPTVQMSQPREAYVRHGKLDRKQAIKDWLKTGWEKIRRGVSWAIEPIGNRLEKISEEVFKKASQLMANVNTKTAENLKVFSNFVAATRKMTRADRRIFDLARKNGESAILQELIVKYGIQKEYKAYRDMMDDFIDRFWNVGIEVHRRKSYHPRVVKDYVGLISYLKGTDLWNAISQEIDKRNAKRTVNLTPREEAELADQMLQGVVPGLPATGNKATKARTIATITPEMDKFYMHSDQALATYIRENNRLIAWREFFGKNNPVIAKAMKDLKQARRRVEEWYQIIHTAAADENPERQAQAQKKYDEWSEKRDKILKDLDLEGSTPGAANQNMHESIGSLVVQLTKGGKLTATQTQDLKTLLQALWDDSGINNPVASLYRDTALFGALSQFSSAITQIQDLAWSFYENGVWHTSQALGKAIAKKSDIKKDDIIPDIMPEFSHTKKASWFLNMALKMSGMEYADTIGKEVLMNASLSKAKATIAKARAGDKNAEAQIRERVEQIFDGDFHEVMAELFTGDPNSDVVKQFAHFMLGEYQPISRLQTPAPYKGNARLAYMLKTYQIKQVNNYVTKIRRGLKKAHKNNDKKEIVRLMGEMTMMLFWLAALGAGADALKDIIYGRKIKPEELQLDVLGQLFGLSRWDIYNTRREGLSGAAMKRIIPQNKLVDHVTKDIIQNDGKGARTPALMPLFGKFYHWYEGRGVELKEKEGKKKK